MDFLLSLINCSLKLFVHGWNEVEDFLFSRAEKTLEINSNLEMKI